MNNREREEAIATARAMTSAERVDSMRGGMIDEDIMTTEIEYRTGIYQWVAEIVLEYEGSILDDPDFDGELNVCAVAAEIGKMKRAPYGKEDLEGIEYIDEDTAMEVMDTEGEILLDCGMAEY